MGILKLATETAKDVGKLAYKGSAVLGKATIKASTHAGNSFLKSGAVGTSIIAGAGLGAMIYDMDKRNPVTGALNGATTVGAIGLGAAMLPGTLGTVGGAAVASGASSLVGGVVGAATGAAGAFAGIGSKMVKVEDGWKPMNLIDGEKRIKLSNLGKVTVGAMVGIGAIKDSYNALEKSRIGSHDGMVRKAAPSMPSYANNGGATGDLVFALHNLR